MTDMVDRAGGSYREPRLLGNGKLTLASRLGVVALTACLPVVAGAILWFLGEVYAEVKTLSKSASEIKAGMAAALERGNAVRADNARQDQDITQTNSRIDGQALVIIDHEKRLIRIESTGARR